MLAKMSTCQRCGEKGALVHCWWECRLVQPLWKTVWNFLKRLKMDLPFDPEIPLLGLFPKNHETPVQKNIYTPMFITVLFIIATFWKQPKCPSVDEWIKKSCGTFTQWNTMKLKKERKKETYFWWQNGCTWRILSELSQSRKDKYHVISLICNI